MRRSKRRWVPNAFLAIPFQIGFLHQTLRAGFKVTEVPFHFVDREIGESKMGPEYLINPLKYLFQVRYQEITSSRIFKFLVVGSIGFVVNFVAYQAFNLLRLWTGLQTFLGLTARPIGYLLWLPTRDWQ